MPILAVAPHWGAWMEIIHRWSQATSRAVAPHWGAWIEIKSASRVVFDELRRTPLGCVD